MSCTAVNGDSLLSLKTHVAGWECESIPLYVLVLVFTVGLQVVRNRLWAKSGQAGREALHTARGSIERASYIWLLLWYTLVSTSLHIVNLLLIFGSNLGVLGAVLLGNLAGTWYAYSYQPADKHRTSEEISDMIKKYFELMGKGRLQGEEYDMLLKMKETREMLRHFLQPQTITVPLATPIQEKLAF